MTERQYVYKIVEVVVVNLIAMAVFLALAACSPRMTTRPPNPHFTSDNGVGVVRVPLPDTRTVTCVTYRGYGISCDWNHVGIPR